MKRSQSSFEFLLLFGIVFLIIISMVGIFINYSNEISRKFDKEYLDNIANEIILKVENVYYLGQDNRITLNFNFPKNIKNITFIHINNTIDDIELDILQFEVYDDTRIYNISYLTRESFIRFNCSINCTSNSNGDISYFNYSEDFFSGPKKIRIESKKDFVAIDFIQD